MARRRGGSQEHYPTKAITAARCENQLINYLIKISTYAR